MKSVLLIGQSNMEMVKECCERELTAAEKRYIALEQFTLGKSSIEEVMKFLK